MFRNNKIYKITKNGKKKRLLGFIRGLKIEFKGKNSQIIFNDPIPKFEASHIKLGTDCIVTFKENKYKLKNFLIKAKTYDATCNIGKNFNCNGLEIHYGNEEKLTVNIGDNCLFADNIVIRASDSHTIKDKLTKKIINHGGIVDIGNHVWCSSRVAILKNVKIEDNIIIGLGSIVTKNCEKPNSIYAGIPAKIIKENIEWSRPVPIKEDTRYDLRNFQ